MVNVITMNAGDAAKFIRDVRTFLGNRRGRLSPQARTAINSGMANIMYDCVDEARQVLRNNRSGGPPLSASWATYKPKTWGHGKWYVAPNGLTFQLTRPPFAQGGHHKAVWSGFLDDQLDGWVVNPGMRLRNPPEVRVGYRQTGQVHPVTGADPVRLAMNIHTGFRTGLGGQAPPRPFLNTPTVMQAYRNVAIRETNRILAGLAQAARSGTP